MEPRAAILFVDLETTGIYNFQLPADHPTQPRVCEVAAVLCDDTGKEIERYESLVKPDGWTIPDNIAAIHGITTNIALEHGKPIAEVLDGFDALLAQSGLLVAFNIKFDDKGLRSERRRLGRPDGFGTIPVFCCMRGATPVCKMERKSKPRKGETGAYKTPKLIESVRIILGREHEGAHRAMADAIAAKDLYFACRDNHEFMAAGSAFKTNADRGAAITEPTQERAEPSARKPELSLEAHPPGPGPAPVVGALDDLFKLY